MATNWFVTLSQKPCHRTDMVETMQENNWLLTSEAITPQSSSLVTWKRSITALVYNSEQQVMVWYERTSTSASFAIHIWIYSDIGWDWKKIHIYNSRYNHHIVIYYSLSITITHHRYDCTIIFAVYCTALFIAMALFISGALSNCCASFLSQWLFFINVALFYCDASFYHYGSFYCFGSF